MKEIRNRLAYLLLGWGFVGLVYYSSDYLQGDGVVLSASWIDHLIPFTPHAVWLYLSFFLIIPLGFLCAPYKRVQWMSFSFVFMSIIAGLCYILFPTTLDYPIDTGTTISSQLLNQLIQIDSSQNCFPSLHVALTIVAVWGCIDNKHPLRTVSFIVWGAGVCISIIQLRRHLCLDFIGGAILALSVGYLIGQIQNYLKKHITE